MYFGEQFVQYGVAWGLIGFELEYVYDLFSFFIVS